MLKQTVQTMNSRAYCLRIAEMYWLYNRGKLQELGELLEKYEGREKMLLRALREKYDPYQTNIRKRKYCQGNQWLRDHDRAFMKRQGQPLKEKPVLSTGLNENLPKIKIKREGFDKWLKKYKEKLAAIAQEELDREPDSPIRSSSEEQPVKQEPIEGDRQPRKKIKLEARKVNSWTT